MRRIRVVHVSNLDVGLKIHMGNYMRYQRDQGYEVSAICHPGRWLTHDAIILDGIFVKIIPFQPRITPLTDLKTLVRLIHYFRQERFDIVHTHTVKPGLLGRLAAKMAGVPVIVHTVHGFYLHDAMTSAQRRFFVMIEKVGAACCHSILSQNMQDIETAIREGICPPDKIRYLGNGIDLSRFCPDCVPSEEVMALRASLGILPHQPVIGIVARLVREKGIYEFIEAAAILEAKGIKARYLVVGTPQRGKKTAVSPERLLCEYGIDDAVMLLGYRSDILEILSLMDIVVLPSYAEGIPRILMESAAIAKPVVATRVRGNVEVVVEGETGLLVPVRDARALAKGILSLLRDPQRAAEMGRRARQRALTHFDERFFFWQTDAEYRRILKARLSVDPVPILKPIPCGETLPST